ncbi:MAG: ABC transporter substrate-binding protein [Clostridiales bacterium]|jgi:iron complex transport system substrate-binding protein|nr:ABC transporter substrate-binding protein [Clostridiales bacterium]
MRRKFITLLIGLILIAGCAKAGDSNAPASAEASAQTSGPVTVTDMKGRTITLSEPAERIVALTAADCEILYAIGAGDRLVGRGEYCDYPLEVLEVTSVESGAETNLEQIIALTPQILLLGTMAQSTEQLEPLESAGIQSVVSDAQDIEGVYTAIQLIGDLMGRQGESEDLISKMKSDFAAVSANAEANKGKTVYFEVSPLEYGLWTAGSGTFMNEIAEMLGLTNCFADVSGWAEISEEQVLDRNPDYIVTVGMYFGEGPKPDDEILGRPGWENLNAVRNGAVLNLSNNELSRPSYRLAEGAKLLNDFVMEHRAPE